MSSDYIFSADAHVTEPRGFYQDSLPASMRDKALHAVIDQDVLSFAGNGAILHRMDLRDNNSINNSGEEKRAGSNDINFRLQDMRRDGIDGEHIFPQMGLLAWALPRELAAAHANVYNEWVIKHFAQHQDIFVPAGIVTCFDPSEAAADVKRLKSMGFKSIMMPVVLPKEAPRYNSDKWDPLWEAIQDAGLVVNTHVATGDSLVSERGPGAAVMNYARLAYQVMDSVALMITSGVFDRFPKLKIVHNESGASWMIWLGERLDESYHCHHFYVRPKLQKSPSEYLYKHFVASFQFDRGAIITRNVTGTDCLMWSSDYPHMEGTFPESMKHIDKIFAGIDVTAQERAAIVGLNAAKLFGLTPKKLSA